MTAICGFGRLFVGAVALGEENGTWRAFMPASLRPVRGSPAFTASCPACLPVLGTSTLTVADHSQAIRDRFAHSRSRPRANGNKRGDSDVKKSSSHVAPNKRDFFPLIWKHGRRLTNSLYIQNCATPQGKFRTEKQKMEEKKRYMKEV